MFCFLPFEHTPHGYAGRDERCEAPIDKDRGIARTICTPEPTHFKSCLARGHDK
jgi:hypothetical protein